MKGQVVEPAGERAAKKKAEETMEREAARRPDNPFDGATTKHFACKACNHEFTKKTIQNLLACPKCGEMCDLLKL